MQESPAFEQAYRKYEQQGVQFLAKRFGFTGTPLTIVIDRDGAIAARLVGPADGTWLAGHLGAMLKRK